MNPVGGLSDDQVAAQFAVIAAAADSTVTCQCDQHHRGCSSPAGVIVEAHLMGRCNGPEANAAGNRVELLCLACARHLWREAQTVAANAKAAGKRWGMVPQCSSCGAPASQPSDLVRSVRKIQAGGA